MCVLYTGISGEGKEGEGGEDPSLVQCLKYYQRWLFPGREMENGGSGD